MARLLPKTFQRQIKMSSTFCFTNVKTLKIGVKQEEAFVVNIFRSGGKHQSLRQFNIYIYMLLYDSEIPI